MNPSEYLEQVADDLAAGKSRSATVRQLLAEFGYQRRGSTKADEEKRALKKCQLTTEPDLLVPYIDDRIYFNLEKLYSGLGRP